MDEVAGATDGIGFVEMVGVECCVVVVVQLVFPIKCETPAPVKHPAKFSRGEIFVPLTTATVHLSTFLHFLIDVKALIMVVFHFHL